MITITQATEISGLSRSEITRAVARGDLNHTRPHPRRVLIHRDQAWRDYLARYAPPATSAPLMTRAEAAERLGVSVRTVTDRVRDGRINSAHIGRHVVILDDEKFAQLEDEYRDHRNSHSTDVLLENVEWLLACSEHPDRIVLRTHRDEGTILRLLYRRGRHDLAAAWRRAA